MIISTSKFTNVARLKPWFGGHFHVQIRTLSFEMRVCCPPHAVIKIARRKQLLRRPLFPFPRPFASTVSTRYPALITGIESDVPPYKPQAQPNPKAKNVAVVGGGITGLTAAYNLTKALPNAKITLFESREKLGGWLDSEIVPVDDGEVLFEWGPRTLRNDGIGAGRYTAQLVGETQEAMFWVLMLFYRWLSWIWPRIFCPPLRHRLPH